MIRLRLLPHSPTLFSIFCAIFYQIEPDGGWKRPAGRVGGGSTRGGEVGGVLPQSRSSIGISLYVVDITCWRAFNQKWKYRTLPKAAWDGVPAWVV